MNFQKNIYCRTFQVRTPQGFLKLGILFAVAGMILLLASYFVFQHEKTFEQNAKHTTGTVIAYVSEERTNSDHTKSTVYYPIIQFENQDHTYTFTSNTGGSLDSYQIGTLLPVLYNSKNPAEAQINSWYERWLGCLVLVGMGMVFLIVGISVVSYRESIAKMQSLPADI